VHDSTLFYKPKPDSIEGITLVQDNRLKSVRKGLFARSIYEAGDEIVHYRGDIISVKNTEKEKRKAEAGTVYRLPTMKFLTATTVC
jgi:hypothetical protein